MNKYVHLLTGRERPSALMTDGYKFSMAQAGFPLREETFYLSFRRGGPFYIPFDLKEIVEALVPEMPTVKEQAFLTANGYGLNPAMEKALQGKLEIWAPPPKSWVLTREPILTITGPSFLVSWLEPLVIMLNYPIQIATDIITGGISSVLPSSLCQNPTCENELGIIELVAQEAGEFFPRKALGSLSSQYMYDVSYSVDLLREEIPIDNFLKENVFEVGMRAATCIEQHRLALTACRLKGINKTSNVYLSWELYMIPVGTTGHEHQQRWGSDLAGFRAIRDMRPEPPSYLFDTWDPISSGIPNVLRVTKETPDRKCSFRFDSGNQEVQFDMLSVIEKELKGGVNPNYIFEDGYNLRKTKEMVEYVPPKMRDRCFFGYGDYLISKPAKTPYFRDRVSAAYKLSQTGDKPTMKFSGTPGKESLPGRPVILRSLTNKDVSMIAQKEEVVDGYREITESCSCPKEQQISPETKRLISEFKS